MVKKEFVKVLAEKLNKSQKEVSEILDTLDNTIIEAMRGNDELKLGMITYKKSYKDAKVGRNPKTGESVQIPAKYSIKIKAGKKIQDAVN